MTIPVKYIDWGFIDYKQAWEKQEHIFSDKTNAKLELRKQGIAETTSISNHLIFCEHPHVYTLGKSGSVSNLLVNDKQLEEIHAQFYPINRGGDITYHGPGQIVVYPIFDLEQFFTDIHKYLRTLEEAVIETLSEYDLKGERFEGYTGVWLDSHNEHKARKICAMGVRCSRWVTMHGLAFNVNSDLSYFKHIVPCGIDDKEVTSMQKELGFKLNMEEVKSKLNTHLCRLFDIDLIQAM
jgi:lipoyl(octanoyl) transferase